MSTRAARIAGRPPKRNVIAKTIAVEKRINRRSNPEEGEKFDNPAGGPMAAAASCNHIPPMVPTTTAAHATQQAFGQPLACDSRARCAHGDADGDLALTLEHRGQLHVGHVGARCGQGEPGGEHCEQQHAARRAEHALGQCRCRNHVKGERRRVLREILLDAGGDAIGVGLRLRNRDAWLDARGRAQPAPPACRDLEAAWPHDLVGHERHPEIGAERVVTAMEGRRRDAGHGERRAVEVNRAADRVGARAESRAPPRVADDGDRCGVALDIVARRDHPPERRVDAQHRKVRAADQLDVRSLGSVAEAERGGGLLMNRDCGKRLRSCAEIGEVGECRHVEPLPGATAAKDTHQFIGPLDRQRPQEQAVDHREDRAAAADAEGQRENRHDGQRRPAHRDSHRVGEVVKKGSHERRIEQCECHPRS